MERRIAALLIFFIAAAASGADDKPLVTLDQVKNGMLLFKTSSPGVYIPAPTVQTDVDLRVRGMILRGEVTQRFRNPESECVEAIYAFPLPETAAVDRLRMKIGDRLIEGEIKERKAAEEVYAQAKSEGKHASLLSQERPNLFTVAIANIASGEEVVVTLGFQQTIDYKDGSFRLRFPTTIGPRYTPGTPIVAPGQAPALDSEAVAPPTNLPGEARQNDLKLTVDLDSGVSLRSVETPAFRTDSTTLSPSHYRLSLTEAPADRDFELVWRPDLGSSPQSALFAENGFALLMLMPPAQSASSARMPKDSIFIVDTSGSMEGASLDSAKKALLLALERLSPRDRFNVIEFNSVTHSLFDATRTATPDVVEEAKKWVSDLKANGGTEMLPALQAALLDDSPPNDGVVRQVIFMTDGDVSNESELFALIRSKLGRSRLFTVGIGAAPNSHFMRNTARFGRGTFTYIADVSEVQGKMTALFEKLESPVLTNVEIHFDDPSAEVWPQRIPDLYAGEPVIVAVKLSAAGGRVTLSGKAGGQVWSEEQSVATTAVDSGIGKLWARMKIESLTDEPSEDTRQKVIDLGLAHHLVTQFTSLVAVDVTPAVGAAHGCETRPIPVNLPAGWGAGAGALPKTATPAPILMLAGALLLIASWRLLCALQ
jgi:Ca-activated chloride channel family protein